MGDYLKEKWTDEDGELNDETVQEVTEVPDEDVSEEETEIPNDETAQETPEELSEKSADTDVASETDVSEQITE